jgi:hypothetical protein
MTGQVPLYLGIPLAILCIAASGFAVMFIIALWNDRDEDRK